MTCASVANYMSRRMRSGELRAQWRITCTVGCAVAKYMHSRMRSGELHAQSDAQWRITCAVGCAVAKYMRRRELLRRHAPDSLVNCSGYSFYILPHNSNISPNPNLSHPYTKLNHVHPYGCPQMVHQ